MKLHVPSIPESGKSLTFDQNTDWFATLIKHRFRDFCSSDCNAHGNLSVHRTNANVSVNGKAVLDIHPTCDRCGQRFDQELSVKLVRHLIPFFGSSKAKNPQEEELELSEDDLEFSCYHNEEIDLAEIVAEEILLALPMRFLCQEDCKGLCRKCGANLNEGACACSDIKEDSPFAVLQSMVSKK